MSAPKCGSARTMALTCQGYRRDGAGCELDDTSAVPKVDKGKKPRAEKTFSLCPTGETACPIAAAPGQALSKPAQIELSARLIPTDGYECMDTTRTLESCGGCVSTGEGKACDQIAHARGVGVRGLCSGCAIADSAVRGRAMRRLHLRPWLPPVAQPVHLRQDCVARPPQAQPRPRRQAPLIVHLRPCLRSSFATFFARICLYFLSAPTLS